MASPTPTTERRPTERRPTEPAKWHAKNHGPWPFEECRRCQRQAVSCRGKRSYGTYQEADVAVREVNERGGYVAPVSRYRCRWCLRWHLTRATRPMQRRRAERQRRKWLTRGS